MNQLKITSPCGKIQMDFCCERLEKFVHSNRSVKLARLGNKTNLWFKIKSGWSSMDEHEPVGYCPFCGEKVNITNDEYDRILYKGVEARKPDNWESF